MVMVEIILFILATLVLPVIIEQTKERWVGNWIKYRLRLIWTVVFVIYSLYLLSKPGALEVAMDLHKKWAATPIFGYIICALLGAFILCMYWWFAGKMSAYPTAKRGILEDRQQPEMILLPPQNKHRYRWIPKERIAIDQGLRPPKELGFPVFEIRNLSAIVITGITITWEIVEFTPVDRLFLSNDYFRRYGANIEESTNMFWLYRDIQRTQGGSGMPVADSATTNIPFCEPTPSTVHAMEVKLPKTIANSYALRIVATTQRPPATNVPIVFFKISGPKIRVTINYRQSEKDYLKYFRIESSIMTISNTTSDGNLEHIDQQYYSEENFRAIVTFEVISE